MKVLSMIQPWASLFILGESKHETRTWRTHYRGPLAIHASQKIDRAACKHPLILEMLQHHGFTVDTLPTGVMIGHCILENCIKVVANHQTWAELDNGEIISEHEYFLGDYRAGNYAWIVHEKKQLNPFIPAKGKLGLWDYPL